MSTRWTEADVAASKAKRAAERQGKSTASTGDSITVLEFLTRGIKVPSRRKKRALRPKDLPAQPPLSALGREAEGKVKAALGRAGAKAEEGQRAANVDT